LESKRKRKFGKVFYSNQKECPKTTEGKMICMNFFFGECAPSLAIEFTLYPATIRKSSMHSSMLVRRRLQGIFPKG